MSSRLHSSNTLLEGMSNVPYQHGRPDGNKRRALAEEIEAGFCKVLVSVQCACVLCDILVTCDSRMCAWLISVTCL